MTFPVEKAHRMCPATWRWEPAVFVKALLEALNIVFLISSCTFTSTLLYPAVILALMSMSSGCLSPKCFKTPPQPVCHCHSCGVGWRLISCRFGPYLTAPQAYPIVSLGYFDEALPVPWIFQQKWWSCHLPQCLLLQGTMACTNCYSLHAWAQIL